MLELMLIHVSQKESLVSWLRPVLRNIPIYIIWIENFVM